MKEIFSFSTEDEEEDTNLYRDIINLLHYYIRRLFYRIKKYRRVKNSYLDIFYSNNVPTEG